MPTIELTDDQYERFRSVRADLQAAYVGEYGTIREQDAVDYLLDTYTPPEALADADGSGQHVAADDADAADADAADPDEAGAPGSAAAVEDDLTTVTGIGETKAAALEEAGFETVTDLHAATVDALATVEGIGEDLAAEIKVALDAERAEVGAPGGGGSNDDAGGSDGEGESDGGPGDGGGSGAVGGSSSGGHDDGAARLDSMMSLLDEHDDVWRESGGDEPYEVELPDGSVETARTKDHVRQLLFKHYR